MNLIDLLSLTKRQYVWYLPKETLEACQQREELAKEIGVSAVGKEVPARGTWTSEYFVFLKICYKSSTSFSVPLLSFVVTQHPVLPAPRLRLPVSLLT